MNALWIAFKDYAHQASVGVALTLIVLTGLIVDARLLFGHDFPSGYDTWIWALIALAGVNVAGMGVVRATGVPYVEAKAALKASGAPTIGNVENANINATAERQVPVSASFPQAGVAPKPEIKAALEQAADASTPVEGEGD